MKVHESVFRWDPWSDQPAPVDRRIKWSLRRRVVHDVLLEKLSASLPLLGCMSRSFLPEFKKYQPYYNEGGIGLCVNLERPLEDKRVLSGPEVAEILEPLNLRRVAVRIPLRGGGNLQEYVEFIRHFSQYEILGVILQDRAHIEDGERLRAALRNVFHAFAGLVGRYQIGNAVNRLKWGFVTQREYFEFFQTAWDLRNREFPGVKLLGGAVIDFDLLEHCRALHNGFPFGYDGYASLLYVDRRGAPENRQFGFDLQGKIDLLRRIIRGSPKLDHGDTRLWITEVNWPLRGTGPYAPALDDCRVGEWEQLLFLVRYYLLVLASGSVAACFWHQLVAPGYGLIDNRGGVVRKRPAFRGFATLCRLFNGARIEDFRRQNEIGFYRLTARRNGAEILALWRTGGAASIPMPSGKAALDVVGEPLPVTAGQPVTIGDSPVYLLDT